MYLAEATTLDGDEDIRAITQKPHALLEAVEAAMCQLEEDFDRDRLLLQLGGFLVQIHQNYPSLRTQQHERRRYLVQSRHSIDPHKR